MGKLHEILAVEPDLAAVFKKLIQETAVTFSKKGEHFLGKTRRLDMFEANAPGDGTEEVIDLTTTVHEKLSYLFEHSAKYLDAVLQKERTNQDARANIVIDGIVIANEVPATFLLGLEAKLQQLREVVDDVPTLAPGVPWEAAPDLGPNIFRTKVPKIEFKTTKTIKSKTLFEGNNHHPPQIEKWNEDVPIGKYSTTVISGMLTVAEKSAILGRIDKLIQATKQARCRANNTDVVNTTIAKELFTYIIGK